MMQRVMQAVARSCRVSAGNAPSLRIAGQWSSVGNEASLRERKESAQRHSLLHRAAVVGSFLWQEIINE